MPPVFLLILSLVLLPASLLAGPVIATPYPLLADCARRVGGNEVEVRLLASHDVHSFAPTARQLDEFASADLVLLLGKGIEDGWVGDLRESVGTDVEIFAVGDALPDLAADGDHAAVCTIHDHGVIDPHWWQSPRLWQDAVAWLADEFGRLDPEHAENYEQRSIALADEIEELRREARRRLARVPRDQRVLAVPHAAFGYLCDEFGLRQVALLGITGSGELPARHLETCLEILEENQVPAIFAEEGAPRRGIDQLGRSSGLPVAGALLADGDERANLVVVAFLEHNLDTIATGLSSAADNDH